jgi:hypothetical protein
MLSQQNLLDSLLDYGSIFLALADIMVYCRSVRHSFPIPACQVMLGAVLDSLVCGVYDSFV